MTKGVVAILAGALAVVAACGTTVSPSQVAKAGSSADGLSAPAATGAPAGLDTVATGPQGSAPPSADATPSETADTTNSASPAGPAPTAPATKSPLKIGVFYTTGLQQLATAFGSSANTPDPKVYENDLISYINKHGGLAGHPLSPVFAVVNTESTADLNTQYQAACSTFTEDNHVFVVASAAPIDDAFAACVTKHNVPVVAAWGIATSTDRSATQSPLVIEPNAPSAEQAMGALARTLVAQKWAAARWNSGGCGGQPTPKIGVLIEDTPSYRSAYASSLVPALAAGGAPIVDTVWMTLSGDVADSIAQAGTIAQSTILRFSAECVDHVLIQAPNPVVPELFMVGAATQHYTPRYGWDSDQAPIDDQETVSSLSAQLRGSIGVGWQPYNDVPVAQFDAAAKAPGARCLAIFTQAGLPPTGRADSYSDLQLCDSLLFLQTAVAGLPDPLTGASFNDSVSQLGTRYAPSLSYSSSFSPTRRAGASEYRDVAFSAACTCFRYTSGLKPF